MLLSNCRSFPATLRAVANSCRYRGSCRMPKTDVTVREIKPNPKPSQPIRAL